MNSKKRIRPDGFSIMVWIVVCHCTLGAFGSLAYGQSEESEPSKRPKTLRERNAEKTPEYWVQQLSHDRYLRREAAAKRLIEAGEKAVPALTKAIRTADLETTTSAIGVLSDLALAQDPESEAGAWGALLELSERGTGSRQVAAKKVVEGITQDRELYAREMLKNAGVSLNYDNFSIGAMLSTQRFVLRIDDSWNGRVDALKWLRWVRGVKYASIRGKAIHPDVLAHVVRLPSLKSIALVNGTADEAALSQLAKLKRIESLEIRYVKLNPQMADLVAKLPVRESLNLMGTGVTEQRVDEMREDLPGLSITLRNGGFMGVTCSTFVNRCQITSVMPGSAAAKAGLRSQDIVTAIDGKKIEVFADLQKIINTHVAGDEIKVVYTRQGHPLKTTVTLGRHIDE